MSSEVTAQAIKLKKEKVIKGITCPSCGGELDLKEGMKTFNCKFCGTLLKSKGESGVLKFYVPKTIKIDQAVNKAFDWLDSGLSKAKGLRNGSKVEDAFMVYIPYWRVKADVVGWVFGQEKHTSNNSTYYEDKEIKIQNSFDATFAACDVAELGVKKVNLEGDHILPVDFETLQQDGMLFNIVSSEKEIYEKALERFKGDAKKQVSLDNTTFEFYSLVRQNISVVYYPLWVIRYSFQNRTYQVVVDGQDGSICYGKAPGSNTFRAVAGVIGTAAGMYLITFFEVFSMTAGKNSFKTALVIYIFAAVIGGILSAWAWKKFRYGGEIEEGTGLIEYDESLIKSGGITKSVSSGLSGFSNSTAGSVVKTVAVGAILGSIFDSD